MAPGYIEGYKLDDEKLRRSFPGNAPDERDDPLYHVLMWHRPILDRIPRGAYTSRAESDIHLVMVIVVESGSDRDKLGREPVR